MILVLGQYNQCFHKHLGIDSLLVNFSTVVLNIARQAAYEEFIVSNIESIDPMKLSFGAEDIV